MKLAALFLVLLAGCATDYLDDCAEQCPASSTVDCCALLTLCEQRLIECASGDDVEFNNYIREEDTDGK